MSKPVVLLDFDGTVFDTESFKRDVNNAGQSVAEYVETHDLASYLFEDALSFFASVDKELDLRLFTEGDIEYQRQKVRKSGIAQWIPETHWMIYNEFSKTDDLARLRQEHPILVVIDNSASNLVEASRVGCITVACNLDQDALLTPVSLWQPKLDETTATVLHHMLTPTLLKRVYMVGITGVGMAALSQMMMDAGIMVHGSDSLESQITTNSLRQRGVQVESFETKIPQVDMVVYSGAYVRGKHPQLPLASTTPTMSLAHALGLWISSTKIAAVCGVGGKTTTSAILAHLCQNQANWYVGTGSIGKLPSGKWQSADWTIIEADEYAISPTESKYPKFSLLEPDILICTNVVHDHPDIYPTFEDTKRVYRELFERIGPDGVLLANADDPGLFELLMHCQGRVITVGQHPSADVRVRYDHELEQVILEGIFPAIFKTQLVGLMNARNQAYAYVAARLMGRSEVDIVDQMARFSGTSRRQQIMGQKNQVTYIDDYAHHPNEIYALLESIKQTYPGQRLVVVFHAHTASRTEALMPEFASSLSLADVLILPPIFTSAREKVADPALLSKLASLCTTETCLVSSLEEASDWVRTHQRAGDVIMTVGAGDVYKLHEDWIKQ